MNQLDSIGALILIIAIIIIFFYLNSGQIPDILSGLIKNISGFLDSTLETFI